MERPPQARGTEIANDTTPTGKLYNHPLIAGLTGRSWEDMRVDRMGRPSYIPSRTFALALLDTIAPADAAGPTKLKDVRQKLAEKAGSGTEAENTAARALLPLLDAAGDELKAARENVEQWFDDVRDRVSGWYKRRTQLIVIILALLVAGGLNVDTLTMFTAFSTDASLRTVVVHAAQQAAEKASNPQDVAASVEVAQSKLDTLRIPMGWKTKQGEECTRTKDQGMSSAFFKQVPCSFSEWVMKVVGLLLTAVALTLGAPFWFDALSKLVKLRSGGAKPKTAAEEAAAAAHT